MTTEQFSLQKCYSWGWGHGYPESDQVSHHMNLHFSGMNMVAIILLTIIHPNAHLIEGDEKQWQTTNSKISNSSRTWSARTCLLRVCCRPRVQAAVRAANTTYKQAMNKVRGRNG
jgi:hypothetical protein